MAIEVQVRTTPEATVVRLSGVGCGELLEMVAQGLREVAQDCALLVIDLDDAVLSDAAHLQAFVGAVADAGSAVRIVCRRLSGRRLLRAGGSRRCPPVVGSMEEALATAVRPVARQADPWFAASAGG